MTTGYYIYYRVAADGARELEPRVRAMQATLQGETGIAGRLMKKRAQPLLWMEVYEGVTAPAVFETVLDRLVAGHRLEDGLQPGTKRTTECFLDGAG